mgnify:CR=1 FL=1
MIRILISIIVLGFIVTFHELGHFFAAKAFQISVIEFAVGMGPAVFSVTKGKTKYSLRALPFGGACVMYPGEEAMEPDDNGAREVYGFPKGSGFNEQPAWKRFLVIFAGPFANMLLAFLLAMILLWNVGYQKPVIVEVVPESAAYEAGLREGDVFTSLSVEGVSSKVTTYQDMQLFLTVNGSFINAGKEVSFTAVSGDGTTKSGKMKAVYNEAYQRALFGFSYSPTNLECKTPGILIRMGIHEVWFSLKSAVETIRMLFRGDVGFESFSGPVQIVAIMDESVEAADEAGGAPLAALALLDISILLSGSMGAMNLFPIPALDGGRLLLILVEMITGKKLPAKVEGIINGIGLALLMALMLAIMFKDIFTLAVK